jgi:hypothetical protein
VPKYNLDHCYTSKKLFDPTKIDEKTKKPLNERIPLDQALRFRARDLFKIIEKKAVKKEKKKIEGHIEERVFEEEKEYNENFDKVAR